jgi:hypothetical protein
MQFVLLISWLGFSLQAELAQQQACDKFEQISIKAKEGMWNYDQAFWNIINTFVFRTCW